MTDTPENAPEGQGPPPPPPPAPPGPEQENRPAQQPPSWQSPPPQQNQGSPANQGHEHSQGHGNDRPPSSQNPEGHHDHSGGNSGGGEHAPNEGGGQPPHQGPHFPAGPDGGSKNMAIALIVLGVLETICCCSAILGLFTGIAGIVLGAVALGKRNNGHADTAKRLELIGMIVLAVGLVLSGIFLAIGAATGGFLNSDFFRNLTTTTSTFDSNDLGR